MRLTTNLAISVLMTLAQALAQAADIVPASWKRWTLGAQIILEALKALLVHFSNPDGTPAQAAYQPVPGRSKPPLGTLGTLLAIWLLLILAPSLSAQTRARPEQLAADPAPAGRVLVVLPSGAIALATLDGVALDTSGPTPVLRAVMPIIRVRSLRWKPSGMEGAWTLPERPAAGTLQLYRNGLLLTEGDDYTIDTAGTRITMLAGLEARAGDIVRAWYIY